MAWVMVGTAAVGVTNAIVTGVKAKRKAKIEAQKAKDIEKRLADFEAARQPVINKADEIRAMKDELSNPSANLPVATQAAEMQMEQTDQALANTLDTIRATGGGAGGATALAQAAAQSKAKVSASIEQQEASNAKAAAQGEAALQSARANIEGKAISEEIRSYGRQEDRDLVQLNRMSTQIENAEDRTNTYKQQAADAFSEGVGATGTALSGVDFSS